MRMTGSKPLTHSISNHELNKTMISDTTQVSPDAPATAAEIAAPKLVIPEVFELAVTGGLKQYAGVGDGRKIQVMPHGIQFLGKMTEEQWLETLGSWKRIKDIYHFGLADIVNYGQEKFGKEKVDAALEQLNFELSDIVHAEAIGQTTFAFRLEGLSSEHYYVLGKELAGAQKEQAKWATLAQKHGLSAFELKKSIESGKVIKRPEIDQSSGRNSGITNIEGITLQFERWERQVGGEEKILHDWDRELKERWLEKVRPIIELANKVQESLGTQNYAVPQEAK